MDVETPDERTRSGGRVLAYLATTAIAAGTVLLPAYLFEYYARAIGTALLVVLLAVSIRTALAGLVALAPLTAPVPATDAELPSVSVVITAYNEASVLPETIAACRALDYPDETLEIVICYEATSTDGTAAIAERAAANDPRITAVERDDPPGGKAAITNRGLAHATGEIVAVIDADQRFEPDAVRRAVGWFVADDSVRCVTGRRVGTNPTDSLAALHATVEHHVAERIEFVARDRLGGFALFTGGQAFFRAELFDDLGPFDETVLLEDVEMACRIHEAGGTIRVDPGIVSREENPAPLRAWWGQRTRWARGGMQVAGRHLDRLSTAANAPLATRLDGVATLGGVLALPFVLLALPVVALGYSADAPATFLPYEMALGGVVLSTPALLAAAVFAADRRSAVSHARREYLAAITLAPYLAVQGIAFLVGFLDEFVFRTAVVYVTSSDASE